MCACARESEGVCMRVRVKGVCESDFVTVHARVRYVELVESVQ